MVGRQVEDLAQCRFARGPQHHRTPQKPKVAETSQQGEVVDGRLSETEPRIDKQPIPGDTGTEGPLQRSLEIRDHLRHQVRVACLPTVVHDDQRHSPLGGQAREPVVLGDPPHVVDHVCARVERGLGDRGLDGVDADRHGAQLLADRRDDRHGPPPFLGRVHFGVTWPARFATDVEHVGAFFGHPLRERDGRFHGCPRVWGAGQVAAGQVAAQEAVARERVGCHVQDADNIRAAAPFERPGSNTKRPRCGGQPEGLTPPLGWRPERWCRAAAALGRPRSFHAALVGDDALPTA